MKKILCFFMVALFAALLFVPCFAAETTVDRGDPVEWFGGGVLYQFSGSGSNAMTLAYFNKNNGFFQANPCSVVSGSATIRSSSTTKSFTSMYSNNGGDYVYVLWDDSSTYSFYSQSELLDITFVLSSIEGITNTTYWTVTEVGSEGFVDSGFSDALTELSTIVSAILSNQYILIAIGLAVAVPLVAWGISKLKSLVKGY